MNNRFSGRYLGRHTMTGEAATDAEDYISLIEKMMHRFGQNAGTCPQGERVVFRESALAQQGGHHRRL